jgi:hypothetical protein
MSEPTTARDGRNHTRVLPGADRPLRPDPLVWVSLLVAAIVATIMVGSTSPGAGDGTIDAVEGAGPAGGLCLMSGSSWCIAEPPGWLLWLFALAVLTPFVVIVLGSVRAFVRGHRSG